MHKVLRALHACRDEVHACGLAEMRRRLQSSGFPGKRSRGREQSAWLSGRKSSP